MQRETKSHKMAYISRFFSHTVSNSLLQALKILVNESLIFENHGCLIKLSNCKNFQGLFTLKLSCDRHGVNE